MPRRNEKIKTGQLYWIKPENSEKGYRVFSNEQLQRLIEKGDITDKDRVTFITSNEF